MHLFHLHQSLNSFILLVVINDNFFCFSLLFLFRWRLLGWGAFRLGQFIRRRRSFLQHLGTGFRIFTKFDWVKDKFIDFDWSQMIHNAVYLLSTGFYAAELRIIIGISDQTLWKSIKDRFSKRLIHVSLNQNAFQNIDGRVKLVQHLIS